MTKTATPFINEAAARKAMWLFLAREGGRWTSRQLAAAIPGLAGFHVSGLLSSMFDGRLVTRTAPMPGEANMFRYGVSGTCVAPRDVSVTELFDVLCKPFAEADSALAPEAT